MATITATGASSIVQPKFVHAGMYSISGRLLLTASSGDVIQMVKVPAGFHVEEMVMQVVGQATLVSAGDTGTLLLHVGDGNDVDRFAIQSVGTTAASATSVMTRLGAGVTATSGVNYTYTAVDTVDISVISATGTASASVIVNIGLVMMGSVDFQA